MIWKYDHVPGLGSRLVDFWAIGHNSLDAAPISTGNDYDFSASRLNPGPVSLMTLSLAQ
jgi:hypothetical protein